MLIGPLGFLNIAHCAVQNYKKTINPAILKKSKLLIFKDLLLFFVTIITLFKS